MHLHLGDKFRSTIPPINYHLPSTFLAKCPVCIHVLSFPHVFTQFPLGFQGHSINLHKTNTVTEISII